PREPSIYREVSRVCDVRDVYVTPGGSSWLHAAVSIRKRGPDDGKNAINAAFKGHKSMKHVFIVDDDVDVHMPEEIEWAMATRFQGDTGIVVFKDKGSSLDPSSDFGSKQTAKVGFDLTIPWGADKKFFDRPKMKMKIRLSDYIE
ncbi:MAG: UbiD family decarboxylase, partial [Candidatus Aenigmarchaeota archaeon]|nr:UbiD family decarboxylase [Candidatus Aenigmarchaeota archaeon]